MIDFTGDSLVSNRPAESGHKSCKSLGCRILARPLGYLIFSLMALIRDLIY